MYGMWSWRCPAARSLRLRCCRAGGCTVLGWAAGGGHSSPPRRPFFFSVFGRVPGGACAAWACTGCGARGRRQATGVAAVAPVLLSCSRACVGWACRGWGARGGRRLPHASRRAAGGGHSPYRPVFFGRTGREVRGVGGGQLSQRRRTHPPHALRGGRPAGLGWVGGARGAPLLPRRGSGSTKTRAAPPTPHRQCPPPHRQLLPRASIRGPRGILPLSHSYFPNHHHYRPNVGANRVAPLPTPLRPSTCTCEASRPSGVAKKGAGPRPPGKQTAYPTMRCWH